MKPQLLPLIVVLVISSLVLVPARPSLAAPEATVPEPLPPSDFLDPTFGGDGKVITDFGGYELGESMALQPDGKIIVAGYTYMYDYLNQSHYKLALSRYTTSGALDMTFDVDGKVTFDLEQYDTATGVALQSDDKIVISGRSEKDNVHYFVLLRCNPNGSLDTTFSGDGKIIADRASFQASANSVAIQSDGKILVAGSWYDGQKTGFSLVRFNSNGSLDTTFNGDGKVITYFGNNSASGSALAIQPDGKIIVVGYSYTGPDTGATNYDLALARYTRNGSLDTTFSNDGKLTTDFGGDNRGSDVVIQSDGKIVVVGTREDPTGSVFNEFALARYHSNGTLDSTFDTDGKVTTRLGFIDYGSSIAIQPDGKLLVTGGTAHSVYMGLDYDFALLRYNLDGSLDTTFDTDGKIILDFSSYDPGDEIALQPDGKILLAGGTLNEDDDFAIARLKVDDRTMTISGTTGIAGVTLSYTDGKPKTVVSQPNGSYSFQVPRGWSGSVTPSKPGYVFSPANWAYNNVLSHQPAQNYTPFPLYSISGSVGVAGVTLSYLDGSAKAVTSQTNGSYALSVPGTWSGTVTPTHPCFTFSPVDRSYTNLGNHFASQDYIPSLNTGTGCSDVSVVVGGSQQGRFGFPPATSTRVSFTGMNNGPVKIMSANEMPLLSAERVIYKVNGVNASFTEMMGLPNKQLDTVYWLPWYNNVDLDTQLRFANVSDSTATVHVYIGGVEMTGSPFTLDAGASTRQSFAGINNGPVKIESNVPIVAAERLIYKVNTIATSFSEMMALPNSQLDRVYWLPSYISGNADTQLRLANVSDSTATVHVYEGWYEMQGSPFVLDAGKSTRVKLTQDMNSAIKIVSDVNIVASERIIYKANGVNTSFTEMMALPNKQLDITYWLPWYNNKDLYTELHALNSSQDSSATVHVYIGGTEITGSPFYISPRQSANASFENVNNGPVQIVSDTPIAVVEQLIYKAAGNIDTSFSRMMGLPNSQLDTIYWFPWYNNKDLDTQLRFGAP